MATDSKTAQQLIDDSKCLANCIPGGLMGAAQLQAMLNIASNPINIGTVTLSVSDIEIGAVELKDATTNNRATINASGELLVSGTFDMPAGASTSAKQDTGNASLASIDGKLTNPFPVSGTVAVSNFPATQPVSGTVAVSNFPAQQHVIVDSGILTSITNPVAVTGTFWQATQPVSGTVTVNAGTNLNTSLLALEAGGNLAAIKLRTDNIPPFGQTTMTGSMPVTIASNQTPLADQVVSMTVFAAVQVPISGALSGYSTYSWQIIESGGGWVDGSRTFFFEQSQDSVNWFPMAFYSHDFTSPGAATSTKVAGYFFAPIGAAKYVRARSNLPGGGTQAGVIGTASVGNRAVAISAPLPAGTNVIGTVNSKTPLTASSPTASTVGVASAQAVASNANRKGLTLVNTSANTISIAFGAAAVLNSGITLYPQGIYKMDEFTFHTGVVNAIASAASSNLAVQEFTT